MAAKLIFLIGLYTVGILCVLPLKKKLPIGFIGLSGFLWGMLVWIVSILIWLMFSGQPALPGALFVMAGIVLSILGVNIHHQTWRMNWQEWLWCLLPTLGFVIIGLIAFNWNYSESSPDSFHQIFLAKTLAADGMNAWSKVKLLSWAPGLPFLHIASPLLKLDYLYFLQPVTSYSFVIVWFYLTQRTLRLITSKTRPALLITVGIGLLLFSGWGMIYQYFYVHNTLHSAVYLFTAIAALWLGLKEDNNAWFVVGVMALIGFGLFRRETPLVAIVFLAILISIQSVPYRIRALTALIPVGVWLVVISWIWVLNRGGGGGVFSATSALIQMVALAGFGGFVVTARKEISMISRLVSRLPELTLIVLSAGIVIGLFWQPEYMWLSLNALVDHLLFSDWWSFNIIMLLVLALAIPNKVPYAKLFTYTIPAFFLLAFLARLPSNTPYRIGWGDSLNRMLTYIIPLLALYVSLKLASLFQLEQVPWQEAPQSENPAHAMESE